MNKKLKPYLQFTVGELINTCPVFRECITEFRVMKALRWLGMLRHGDL